MGMGTMAQWVNHCLRDPCLTLECLGSSTTSTSDQLPVKVNRCQLIYVGLCHPHGRLDEAPGFWLWLSPALALSIWRVRWEMEDPSLSCSQALPFCAFPVDVSKHCNTYLKLMKLQTSVQLYQSNQYSMFRRQLAYYS